MLEEISLVSEMWRMAVPAESLEGGSDANMFWRYEQGDSPTSCLAVIGTVSVVDTVALNGIQLIFNLSFGFLCFLLGA